LTTATSHPKKSAEDTLEASLQIDGGAGDSKLSLLAFQQLAGQMAGYAFVKVVVERANKRLHFINARGYKFHADYIAEQIMGLPAGEILTRIDEFNKQVYLSEDRPYVLGIIALHKRDGEPFFTLETVEIDNMSSAILIEFYDRLKQCLDPTLPLFFKPANHHQESIVRGLDSQALPRLYNHELYATQDFVLLNAGEVHGRLRLFTDETYRRDGHTLKWYDIICMDRVPDDIPRVSGLINAAHTTPLSHTNVLACGWGIPNAVQVTARALIIKEGLDGQWVRYAVESQASSILLEKEVAPSTPPERPTWSVHRVRLEQPETENTEIKPLGGLRMTDRYRFGTKAANLGELVHILAYGSPRLTGYYRVPRAARANLLPYLNAEINSEGGTDLSEKAWKYLASHLQIPRGIALPFSLQQEFLQSSWKIQQAIGRLKMALELGAKETESLCLELQRLIRTTRLSDHLREHIDEQIATHMAGVRTFVVRSSSNAEDLKDFSAAGIYESINHVTTSDKIFESIKEVWGSLVSPRSVRLRDEVGLSLDDCYMGVIIQEEVQGDMGGVMVTINPADPVADFRNVYINVSEKSATEVVAGKSMPGQYLYNTVEGGGRTLAKSDGVELSDMQEDLLQRLAFCGRLLQSHFAQDYAFSTPVDIEWSAQGSQLYLLQLRPYKV